MTSQSNSQEPKIIVLHDGAVNAAVDAANEAAKAGLEPHEELLEGIRAYLQFMENNK